MHMIAGRARKLRLPENAAGKLVPGVHKSARDLSANPSLDRPPNPAKMHFETSRPPFFPPSSAPPGNSPVKAMADFPLSLIPGNYDVDPAMFDPG